MIEVEAESHMGIGPNLGVDWTPLSIRRPPTWDYSSVMLRWRSEQIRVELDRFADPCRQENAARPSQGPKFHPPQGICP